MIHLIALAALLPSSIFAGGWALQSSEISYQLNHPMHNSKGTSRSGRGKGVCEGSICRFLVAAPVNTFESGDSNRDVNMVKVTRAAKFPMVKVETSLDIGAAVPQVLEADLTVSFAGETMIYPKVRFTTSVGEESKLSVSGVVPAKLSDFKIDPPSLLMIKAKNDIPITVSTVWMRTP